MDCTFLIILLGLTLAWFIVTVSGLFLWYNCSEVVLADYVKRIPLAVSQRGYRRWLGGRTGYRPVSSIGKNIVAAKTGEGWWSDSTTGI